MPSKVQATGNKVNRETLARNSLLVTIAIEELGQRVSVNTCAFHVEALYEYMKLPLPGWVGLSVSYKVLALDMDVFCYI